MRIFTMRWGDDGKPVLSKHAPELLRQLVAEGHFIQKPLATRRPVRMAKLFKEAPDGVPNENNKYGVVKGQVWVDGDPRQRGLRHVRIVQVGETHAKVKNVDNRTQSFVRLSSFSGKGRDYRLLEGVTS